MLNALYNYAMSHPEVLLPFGCERRTIKYAIDLTAAGQFVGIVSMADDGSNGGMSVVCPSIGSDANSPIVSNPLMEKAGVVLGIPDEKIKDDKKRQQNRQQKRVSFLSYFEEGRAAIPEFGVVHDVLSDIGLVDLICADAIALGIKAGDVVGFRVDNALLSDMPAVISWWSFRMGNISGNPYTLDLITGEPCVPVRKHKKISAKASGGGQGSGTALVSFDKGPFESYGLKRGDIAPMAVGTSDAIMDALNYLGLKAPLIAGMKFLYWYDHDIPADDDLMMLAFGVFGSDSEDDDIDEAAKNAQAETLLTAPLCGSAPPSLAQSVYYAGVLKPESGRLTIRSFECGTCVELYNNVVRWFSDMKLIRWDGKGMLGRRKFNAVLYALLSDAEKSSAREDKFGSVRSYVPALMNACFHGGTVPYALIGRILSNIRSSVYEKGRFDPIQLQVLKLWIVRTHNEGSGYMQSLDVNSSSIGYQCGRLLAVYEAIQKKVSPNVDVGVMERFYPGCSKRPAFTLARLQQLSNAHMRKLRSGQLKAYYKRLLSEIYACIPGSVPRSLSVDEQAYFAVGYWHQHAYMQGGSVTQAVSDDEQDIENQEEE